MRESGRQAGSKRAAKREKRRMFFILNEVKFRIKFVVENFVVKSKKRIISRCAPYNL